MAEVQNQKKNVNWTSDTTNPKKRKGFWSNLFGRSSNMDGKKADQVPQHNGGVTNTVKTGAGQVAQHVAVHEASKEIEKLLDNNDSNGSQPANTSAAPDTTAVDDALRAPTNWAKRMVDSAQQKLQGLGS